MTRALAFLLATAALVRAQSIEARPKPQDYPVTAQLERMLLGSEFQGRSIMLGRAGTITEDYIVIEVGLYPGPLQRFNVAHNHFTLRLNGKDQLLPSPPGFVTAALKYPEWERRRNVQVGAGPVVLGGPPRVERFPGDPNGRRTPVPGAPQKEPDTNPNTEQMTTEELIKAASLLEGEITLPIGGYLYYPYKGKLAKLKSVELIYSGPAGGAVLKLR